MSKYNNINNHELEEEKKQDLSGSFVELQQSSISNRKHNKRLRREMEEMEQFDNSDDQNSQVELISHNSPGCCNSQDHSECYQNIIYHRRKRQSKRKLLEKLQSLKSGVDDSKTQNVRKRQ